MRPCPQCGYEGTKSHRQLMALYRKHFPDIPVWDMVHRGWITTITEPTDSQTDALIALTKQELMRFFDLNTEAQWQAMMDGTWEPFKGTRLSVCDIEPARPLLGNDRPST